MKKQHDNLPPDVKEKLALLDDMSDEDIDFSDIPEITDWTGARRGMFYKYRVIKKQVTLRLDAGIIAWFKAQSDDGRGYQTRINEALREHIRQQVEKTKSD